MKKTDSFKPLNMAVLIAMCQALHVDSPQAIIEEIESCYVLKQTEGKELAQVSNVVKYFSIAKQTLVSGQSYSPEDAEIYLQTFPDVNDVIIWLAGQIGNVINPAPIPN